MSIITRTVVGVTAAGLLAFGLSQSAAHASTAGGQPDPTPTSDCTTAPPPITYAPTAAFGYDPCPSTPPPTPKCQVVLEPVPQPLDPNTDFRFCRNIKQQEFDVSDHGFLVAPGVFRQQDQVLGTGPIRFDLGRDITVSPVLDRFSDVFGVSVLVHHRGIVANDVSIDLLTCSIRVTQTDVPWWIRGGGTGIDRNAIAAGLYDLNGLVSFPTRHFQCTLPPRLTPLQAAYDLDANTGLPIPLMSDFAVQASGWASVQPHLTNYLDTWVHANNPRVAPDTWVHA